jgi:hypothetical protein
MMGRFAPWIVILAALGRAVEYVQECLSGIERPLQSCCYAQDYYRSTLRGF